ncbi:L-seryl-tRNA(Ser) seleniumtransferase [Clostridiales Family XIII bacterium PM5-7]
MNKELIKKVPKVDELLKDSKLIELEQTIPHHMILSAARNELAEMRNKILQEASTCDERIVDMARVVDAIISRTQKSFADSLINVINATGVTLHTNLGRANLSERACNSVAQVSCHYSTLEYNVELGERGSRHSHVENVIKDITGAEAAMVVNNNAAATMLCLSVMGAGKEIIVSRGELVEIGGSFRVPDIMAQSGAQLVEIGTTNKTRIDDYEAHITEETSALMKVHTSNYRVVGFTEEASLEELVALGEQHGLPVIYDMGSGLMVNLEAYGVCEPTVIDSLNTGIDVILFSGDKLLGGPQGGIIAGKKEYIDRMKKHPLARVLRVDKMTLAAMEATFREYYDMEKAVKNIPVLNCLMQDADVLRQRAEALAERINGKTQGYHVAVEPCQDQVGGGSAPTVLLDSFAVAITSSKLKPQEIERKLREGQVPIIARINKDKVYFGVRTIKEEELETISDRLAEMM